MRIGLVCPYDVGLPGGVQQQVSELGAHLRDRGHEVTIVGAGSRWFESAPAVDDVTVFAGRSISVPANRSRVPLSLNPTPWGRVRRALSGVDVIHVHEPLIPLVGWMGLSVAKPLVATFHADAPDWARGVYSWLPLRRHLSSARLTAVSPTARRAIPEEWGEVTIIPNAIDVEAFDVPAKRVDNQVCFLGRDEGRKGLRLLLGAWPEVKARHPNAELVVMGAERDPVAGVTFLGRVSGDQKTQTLLGSRVFVSPALGGESFGIVLVEAMAAGCALVVSDLPAFVDVAGDDATYFPTGEAPALADAVSRLLDDPELATEMGRRARARSHRYDWSIVADRYEELYREVAVS